MKNKILLLIRGIYKIIKAVLFIVFSVFNIIFRFFKYVRTGISNKLRFSITFKITITYVLVFSMLFFLMSIGIVASFHHYIEENPPENYEYLLAAILLVFNLIGVLLIIIIGSRVSRRLLAPIKTMTKSVQEISVDVLDRRLDISGSKDELKDLAETFNGLLDRIQKSFEQQNRFVSDASHELRTPISVIQGYADLLARWGKDDREVLDESIAAIQGEAQNMTHLIEGLLFLARADGGNYQIAKEEFVLSEIVNVILRESRIIDNSHHFTSEICEDFTISADKKLLKEAVRILMDNSIKYTPEGGTINLNCYLKKDKAIISIEDCGIGIPKEDLPFIFNRFYRADKSRAKERGGTGLGLAIAKLIIDSNQGKINVWSGIDAGTVFRIELPL